MGFCWETELEESSKQPIHDGDICWGESCWARVSGCESCWEWLWECYESVVNIWNFSKTWTAMFMLLTTWNPVIKDSNCQVLSGSYDFVDVLVSIRHQFEFYCQLFNYNLVIKKKVTQSYSKCHNFPDCDGLIFVTFWYSFFNSW